MIKILDDLDKKWSEEGGVGASFAGELRAAIPVVDELIKAAEEAMRLEFLAVLTPPSYPGEIRTLPQSNGALVRHDAKIKAQQKELVEALEFANEQMGWLGTGPDNRNIFYCEHCKRSNLDYTLILHEDNCAVTKIRAILARVKGA